MAPDVQRRETGFVLCSHVESFTMGKLERARGNILTEIAGETRNVTPSGQARDLFVVYVCRPEDEFFSKPK